MAAKQIPPKVNFAQAASDELRAIWQWNALRYNEDHATDYISFLKSRCNQLAEDYRKGRVISSQPDLRYIIIQRRRSGYGHAAVYGFDSREITIFHVFHTAPDWQSKLTDEE